MKTCPKISVLMSTYNETEREILESVNSVLQQSFVEFELIIVNDNPNNTDLKETLIHIASIDKRIRVIENDHNIGLAESLNIAASCAKAAIFARIDADDICERTRLEQQIKYIEQGYDLVISRYTTIDQDSNIISSSPSPNKVYSSQEIADLLPLKSVIHHPTVMMTKNIFEKAGGYRNFPCAQDYDLWLRILDSGGRFFMISDPLIQYRIREGSISSTRKLRQQLTIEYIRSLYIERLKNGFDSFSKHKYESYLAPFLENEEKNLQHLLKGGETLKKALQLKNAGKKTQSAFLKSTVCIFNPMYRHIYFKLFISILKIRKLRKSTR